MSHTCGAVILAGGQGTRFKIKDSKPMAPILGKRLIDYPVMELIHFYKQDHVDGEISVVTGHSRENLEDYLSSQYLQEGYELHFAFQEKQLGTADALRCYLDQVPSSKEDTYTIVLCADTPLIRCEDIELMYNTVRDHGLDGVAATFIAQDPKGYGRIVRKDGSDDGFHIVEEKDADEEIRKVQEVNSGFYVLKTSFILDKLDKIDNSNQSNEFYLTDLFQDNHKVRPIIFEDATKFNGVNDLEQFEEIGEMLRSEKNRKLRADGVRFIDSKTNYIDWAVEVEPGTLIHPNVTIEGNSKIGKDVVIESGAVIKNAQVMENVKIFAYSYLEEVTIGKDASIGPFARLRPKTEVGEGSKIGNFVEIKKATLDKGVKVSHLSYVGDALIGEDTNIGCGFITCNYDGANKHVTKIGKGTFVGSDSQTIAPVDIGDECFIASGTTVTDDMPDGAFAISRNKQTTKEKMAKKFIKRKKG